MDAATAINIFPFTFGGGGGGTNKKAILSFILIYCLPMIFFLMDLCPLLIYNILQFIFYDAFQVKKIFHSQKCQISIHNFRVIFPLTYFSCVIVSSP